MMEDFDSVVVSTARREKSETRPKRQPPYAVILHMTRSTASATWSGFFRRSSVMPGPGRFG